MSIEYYQCIWESVRERYVEIQRSREIEKGNKIEREREREIEREREREREREICMILWERKKRKDYKALSSGYTRYQSD